MESVRQMSLTIGCSQYFRLSKTVITYNIVKSSSADIVNLVEGGTSTKVF